MNDTLSSELPRGSHWREKYRVRLGFAFGLLFLWRAQPRSMALLLAGLLVALAGILVRQWAAGCVKKMDEVAQTGPYALIRHPLYFGSFLAAAGMILSSTSIGRVSQPYFDRSLLFWAFLWIFIDSIYLPKMRSEEVNLREKFGAAYEDYAARVPQLLPKKFRFRDLDFKTFSWELWKKNAEYGSLIGFTVIYFVLFARYFYR